VKADDFLLDLLAEQELGEQKLDELRDAREDVHFRRHTSLHS
jgi:hypothetical protein